MVGFPAPDWRRHRRYARYGLLDAVSTCEPGRACDVAESIAHTIDGAPAAPEFVLAAPPRFT